MDFTIEACCCGVAVGIFLCVFVNCIVRGHLIVNWATNEDQNPLRDRTATLPGRRAAIDRLKKAQFDQRGSYTKLLRWS